MPNVSKLRCSSLPLVAACAASLDAQDLVTNSAGVEARAGSAAHDVLARAVVGKEWGIEAAVRKWDVPLEEVSRLTWGGWRCWEQLSRHFPDQVTEQKITATIDGIELSGHPDVLSVVGDELRVLDFKSGRLDGDHEAQLLGYGLLGLHQYPECQRFYGIVLRIREQEYDAESYTREQVESWWRREIVAKVQAERRAYSPSARWCGHCPRGLTCPAKTKKLEQGIQGILGYKIDFAGQSVEEQGSILAELLEELKFLGDSIDELKAMAKAHVANQPGRQLPIGDTRKALVMRTETHQHIGFEHGWDVLMESPASLGDLMKAVKISKTAAESAVRAGAPNNKRKKAAWDAVMDQLQQAGAITTSTVEKLETKSNVSNTTVGGASETPSSSRDAARPTESVAGPDRHGVAETLDG